MYILFNNIEEFNEWHSEIKTLLGIPSEDGTTTEYTTAKLSVIDSDPRVVASFTNGDFDTEGLNLISIENIFDAGILAKIEVSG
jgi:intein/homing endonuclease